MVHIFSSKGRHDTPTRGHMGWAIALLALVLLALGLVWIPRAAGESRIKAGRSVELSGQHSDQQFVTGDKVTITANVSDDIFAAGREVTLEGARAQSLVTGAGKLVLRNSEIRDLIAGALDVELLGQIEDDAVIAVYIILAAMALVTSGYATGLWLRDRKPRGAMPSSASGRIGWTVLGLAVLLLTGAVPFVGWALLVLAFLAGLGAMTKSIWERLRAPAHAKGLS
jgi:hypothetical protein